MRGIPLIKRIPALILILQILSAFAFAGGTKGAAHLSLAEQSLLATALQATLKAPMSLAPSENTPCPDAQSEPGASSNQYPSASLPEWSVFVGEATVLSEQQVQSVFERLARLPHLPFGYSEDGCYARAHEMARILELNGIKAVKVFVEPVHSNERLAVRNPHSPSGLSKWVYHVAPAVLVRKRDKIEPVVLDPSIFNHPVSVKEWTDIQIRHNPTQELDVYFRNRKSYLRAWSENLKSLQDDWDARDRENSFRTLESYKTIQDRRSR